MSKKDKVFLIPLGGGGEIGKNMLVVESEEDIIVIDSGLAFPGEEMLGIDIVIPDITYLLENQSKVRAIFLSHGHEDHIGALPYVLQQLSVPVYGTKLTLGLVKGKLKEFGMEDDVTLCEVSAGERIRVGTFEVEFIRVNHSIADVVAFAIHSPAGIIIIATDFKFDHTPIGGKVANFHKFAELGDQGVALLVSDSTNAERPGYTLSEKVVGETFEETFRLAKGRIIVASFASNIHRIQQVLDAAAKYRRKVAVVGRSMVNVVSIASELGYLVFPEGLFIDVNDIGDYRPEQLAIITTGSQGEPMSALTQMAMASHKKISIIKGDTVIISASPVPGNEKLINNTINHLFKQGAKVVYEAISGVHVSGHGSREELKLMINLTKPHFMVPFHGEYRHLIKHAELAEEVGIPRENIFLLENGNVLELTNKKCKRVGDVTAGKVLVDGLGVGDVGNIVLRDRKQLSQDGIFIVVITIDSQTGAVLAGPDIVSRGFVYVRESEPLLEESRLRVKDALEKCQQAGITEWSTLKSEVRDALSRYLYEKIKRRPMILPIIMEI
jgi:ribonuclease J